MTETPMTRTAATPPDVTVITAVYNTMPYLRSCLKSLAKQTIGLDRMEIIAVDDGSTDGSVAELDRFASEYPDTVHVIHQANSGGPAAPSNRALDVATGRYVFFIGADDRLGREALERLVAAADEYESDVVLGRMVGANGRYAHQAIFRTTQIDVDLFDSPLPYHLSNTKLFRRELLEKHKIRYPEDMPVASDQPFTLEACLRAARISVLSKYKFYYSVRRKGARNMTYTSDQIAKLRYTTSVMAFVAKLLEPGSQRDAVFLRHFDWELSKLVEDRLLRLAPDVQERVRAGVATLADAYLTVRIRDQLRPESRVRLAVAQHGTRDQLVAVIRQDAERGVPRTVIDGDRWYAAYPGFRDGSSSLPDACFDVTPVARHWARKADLVRVRHRPLSAMLTVTVRGRAPIDKLGDDPIALRSGGVAGRPVATKRDGEGWITTAAFPVDRFVAEFVSPHLWVVSDDSGGPGNDVEVRAPTLTGRRRMLCITAAGTYAVTIMTNDRGQVEIGAERLTRRWIGVRLRYAVKRMRK